MYMNQVKTTKFTADHFYAPGIGLKETESFDHRGNQGHVGFWVAVVYLGSKYATCVGELIVKSGNLSQHKKALA